MSLSRRRLFYGTAGSVGGIFLGGGCKKKLPAACTDTTGLPPEDVQSRTTLAYVDATPWPDKTCETCQQYVPAQADGACGTCKILKGPMHPYGYCKSFAKKA